MDINKPIENPELLAAINQMQTAPSQENEELVFAALKKAHFLAPVIITPPPPPGDDSGQTQLKADTQIKFEMLTNKQEQLFFPIFTDWSELRRWKNVPNQQTLVMRLEDYCRMLEENPQSGVTLNPYNQNLLFSQEWLHRILGKPMPLTVKESTPVQLGTPAAWPEQLVGALSAYMQTEPAIRAAWLRLMVKGSEQSFLIVVDHDGDTRTVFDGIGKVAVPNLRPGELLDMVPASDSFGQSAIGDAEPFFLRQ